MELELKIGLKSEGEGSFGRDIGSQINDTRGTCRGLYLDRYAVESVICFGPLINTYSLHLFLAHIVSLYLLIEL